MSRRSITELLATAEWYAAMYGLAAHRSHAAFATKDDKNRREALQRAREEALLLAFGSAAWVTNEGKEPEKGWPPALQALGEELFPERAGKGRTPALPTPVPLVPKRYAVRRRARATDKTKLLAKFVADTVEPSALVLLAGIVAALEPPTGGGSDEPWTSDKDLIKALTEATKGKGPNPERLVATAVHERTLEARASYNVACYYAQTARSSKDDRLEKARSHLARAVYSSRGTARVALVAWAWKDPVLAPALKCWPDAEEVLGPRPSRAETPESPELEQIAAIGGYAGALAKLNIRTAEDLRAALLSPAHLDPLELEPTTAASWEGLLDLLAIKGIGPAVVNLLEAAGIRSPAELDRWDPEALHRRLADANRARRLVRYVPSAATLREWQRRTAP